MELDFCLEALTKKLKDNIVIKQKAIKSMHSHISWVQVSNNPICHDVSQATYKGIFDKTGTIS